MGLKLYLSTAFHPQKDEQVEHTIKNLEDMLRACGSISRGIGTIIYHLLSLLTTTFTIRESNRVHMKFFMGEDADLLLGGWRLVKQGL